jgi:hypothetical protein
MMDAGPVELEAMMATLSLSNDNCVDDPAWQYYAEKYNSKRKVVPVCEFHQEKRTRSSAPSGRISSNTWQTEKRIVRGLSRIRNVCKATCYGACGQDFQRTTQNYCPHKLNILPGRWQHVWLVAIVPPERWGKWTENGQK